jgi:hypothetical protein
MSALIHPFFFQHNDGYPSERLSLEECANEIWERASALTEAHVTLQRTCAHFHDLEQVWPEHWEGVELAIRKYGINVEFLCRLLDGSTMLPEAIIPQRYSLILVLHHAAEQVQRIIPLIQSFRMNSCTMSSRIIQQRRQMHDELNMLVRNGEGLQQQCIAVIDRARFQERALRRLTL